MFSESKYETIIVNDILAKKSKGIGVEKINLSGFERVRTLTLSKGGQSSIFKVIKK